MNAMHSDSGRNSIKLITQTYDFIFPKPFMKKWYSLGLTLNDRYDMKSDIIDYLVEAPDNNYGNKLPGDRLKHTGGAIKMRFSPRSSNKGKSGSNRVIYFLGVQHKIAFLTVYGKKDKQALSDADNKLIHQMINYFDKKFRRL